MKELVLICGTKETKKALTTQLNDILGNSIHIWSYSIEEGLPHQFENQLVVLSSYLIEEDVEGRISSSCDVIVAKRTVNYEYIDQLFFLPPGTKALYVNDFPASTTDAIHTLMKLGIDHIEYYPYFPNASIEITFDVAITPGELAFVPPSIPHVIDIGVRLIDISTIYQILQQLNLVNELDQDVSEKYIKKIIELGQNIAEFNKQTDHLNSHLKKVVNGVNDGILAFNRDGKITVFNDGLQKMTSTPSAYALQKSIHTVFKNSSLIDFLLKQKESNDAYFTLDDIDVVVHRFLLESEQTVVATFKSVKDTIAIENAARKELIKKGYIAKYRFADIIGDSSIISGTKQTAAKLARTNLAVLIQGESGTGKELFASAIHNESARKHGPFLAVNFSALPEDLLESELFGYEEGAFTGAKKGGKQGIFEQGHGGTIFLDEIGDSSPKLQARLLRVLQEKEVRRVGGTKNIPIDVRIIAATNCDLQSMITEGTFRRDLYHRLKVLYLELPPLRKRTGDLPILMERFIQESEQPDVYIQPQVIEALSHYPWYGNVRELKNTVEYMLAVCDENEVTTDDLPSNSFFELNDYQKDQNQSDSSLEEFGMDELILLSGIYALTKQGVTPSRKRLVEFTEASHTPLSEQQVRYRLEMLEEKGLVMKQKGRGGTKLTQKGYVAAEKLELALS